MFLCENVLYKGTFWNATAVFQLGALVVKRVFGGFKSLSVCCVCLLDPFVLYIISRDSKTCAWCERFAKPHGQRLRSVNIAVRLMVIYTSKIWICTHFFSCTCRSYHTFLFPSTGGGVHPREGEESREEAGRKPVWPRRLEHTDSWSTGLVTQGCIPSYPGWRVFGRERGSLTAHLMLFHLWDVPYDSVCKWISLLLESTHRQSKEDIRATCRPVSQFGQILEAIHWSRGYTLF